MKTTTDFQLVSTDKLIPYVNNARTHSPEQIKKLRSSLREFGFVNPVIIDREYNVIAGHGRLMAAKEEGITEVPCVYVDHLTDAQKKAYILADNRMAMDAGWDEELLAVEMQELQDLGYDLAMTGFDEKELADLFSDNTDSDAKDDNFDLTAALEKASFVERGDVWTVGRHRLMCGDATSPEDVNILMGDTKANLILTDPPYGVSFKSASGLTIQNDSMKNEEFYNFLLSAFKCMADHLEKGGVGVEARRHQFYKVVKPSRYIKIYYATAGIDVFAEGYVESCEVQNFEQLTTGQISILCPDIYWYSTTSVMAYYSQITGAFTFPFPTESNPGPFILGKYNTQNMMTIVNDGDEIGFTLVIEALEDARSPTLYNADTDEYLQITGDILAGDIITVTTKTGNKTVTLDRGGVKTNIINRLVSGSTWLTLREGRNRFYLRGTGLQNLKVTIVHTNAYLGV